MATSSSKRPSIGAAKAADFKPDFDLGTAFDKVVPDKQEVELKPSGDKLQAKGSFKVTAGLRIVG